jgi:hypothetical protein
MTVDDQIRAQPGLAGRSQAAQTRARALARRAVWRLAPGYARRLQRKRGLLATVQRLQADFEHVSKRHSEQIERLEDLTRELVSTAESLRREIARREQRDRG